MRPLKPKRLLDPNVVNKKLAIQIAHSLQTQGRICRLPIPTHSPRWHDHDQAPQLAISHPPASTTSTISTVQEEICECQVDRHSTSATTTSTRQVWGLMTRFEVHSRVEVFHDQVACTFMRDRTAIVNRDIIGKGNILWGSDYPHFDGAWPNSSAALERQFGGVPLEDQIRIGRTNAIDIYKLPIAH